MLDIQFIRENPEKVQENAENRHLKVDIQHLLAIDDQLRSQKKLIEDLRAERNRLADAMKKGKDDALVARAKELKKELAELEPALDLLQSEYDELIFAVPNMTHPDSPFGKDDSENMEIHRFKEPTTFAFEPKDHVTLGKDLDLYDFEAAAETVGSGFYYTKNEAALLELALTHYAMEVCLSEGFSPMLTPDLARQSVLRGTGYNPRGDETQIYNIENTDLSLIATSEITVAGYYQKHLFEKGELDEPKKIVAFSHCFRTEAGSYGRESKGLYRVHQFSKVEMFIFCKPEDSAEMHEELLRVEEKIMQGLELPYRVVDICTGDLGGPAYRKYDIEAWMPFKNDWGEVTSTSNCTDFQARNLNIKFVNEEGEREFVHMLNGTAIVTSRVPIALLENYQQADGSIKIPTVLHPYMFGRTHIQSH